MPNAPSTADALLRASDLAVSPAPGIAPLARGFQLAVAPGELVAVTGPSGVGKSTLLRVLAGLRDPDAGAVTLQGRAPGEWGWPEYRRRVTLVAQKPALLDASVDANLRRPFCYRSARASGAPQYPADRAAALLDALGVGASRLNQAAGTLSVGQQQRVALIRALLINPLVICLDEPTSALDPDTALRVEALVAGLARAEGLAALIVTHSPEQARRWCARAVALAPAAGAGSG